MKVIKCIGERKEKMGRYYSGDIDGKFWLAVQPSDDADYFGVKGKRPNLLEYWYEDDDLPIVKESIENCKNCLGDYKEHLDDFFNDREGYNNEMLAEFLNKKTNKKHTEQNVMFYLEWYARLGLGQQIHDCIKNHGQCYFEAEL
mgnify:CR=1 FL=1